MFYPKSATYGDKTMRSKSHNKLLRGEAYSQGLADVTRGLYRNRVQDGRKHRQSACSSFGSE